MRYTEILQCFLQKDNSFFNELYQNNYYKIKKFVFKNSGTEEEAKELFQIAFIILFERITQKKFKPENLNHLEAYLFQIGKFKWIDQCKQKHQTITWADDAPEPFISEDDFTELNDVYDKRLEQMSLCLKQLKDPCKSILKQFYYQNLSYDEIAMNLDYSASILKTMKYRCLNKLKKLYYTQ